MSEKIKVAYSILKNNLSWLISHPASLLASYYKLLLKKTKLLNLLGILLFSIATNAMNGRTTNQVKIIKLDGYPLEATNVTFEFSVLDTVGSCVLYSETYSAVNMTSTGGLISFALGGGTRSFPAVGAPTAVFAKVFDNSIISMPCEAAGIYNPGPNDTRKIVMRFNDGKLMSLAEIAALKA